MLQLKSYSITEESIPNILKEKGIMGIIEPLWWSVDIYQDYEVYEKDLERFTLEQRYFFAMEWYFSEVYNGGVHQFLSNSTGIVGEDALKGFEMLEVKDDLEIIKQIRKIMGGKIPFDRQEREEILDNLSEEQLEKLNSLFHNDDEYQKLGEEFILRNKEKFIFEGEIEAPTNF